MLYLIMVWAWFWPEILVFRTLVKLEEWVWKPVKSRLSRTLEDYAPTWSEGQHEKFAPKLALAGKAVETIVAVAFLVSGFFTFMLMMTCLILPGVFLTDGQPQDPAVTTRFLYLVLITRIAMGCLLVPGHWGQRDRGYVLVDVRDDPNFTDSGIRVCMRWCDRMADEKFPVKAMFSGCFLLAPVTRHESHHGLSIEYWPVIGGGSVRPFHVRDDGGSLLRLFKDSQVLEMILNRSWGRNWTIEDSIEHMERSRRDHILEHEKVLENLLHYFRDAKTTQRDEVIADELERLHTFSRTVPLHAEVERFGHSVNLPPLPKRARKGARAVKDEPATAGAATS